MLRNGHKKSALGAVAPSEFRSPNLVAELAATTETYSDLRRSQALWIDQTDAT
jgi:hypothetical protein